MPELFTLNSEDDIPLQLRQTPIGEFLRYHNFNAEFKMYTTAGLLIGMCMDNRKTLRVPDNFAYILRTGGANLRYSEFKVAYAVAVGGVRYIVLLGHTRCSMVGLINRKDNFINGMVDAGWERKYAENFFNSFAPTFEIVDAENFVFNEAVRLRALYPKVVVVPMIYDVDDNKIRLFK
jgi:carbonic anhydrase